MQRELTAGRFVRPDADKVIFDPAAGSTEWIGRVLLRGLADEPNDRHFLIVDGTDGRTHYVDIGKGQSVEPLPEAAIVRVAARQGGARQADRTVLEVAAANGGRYSIEAHRRHDPGASEAFAQAHVRRLEAMRRLTASVQRMTDGTWLVAPDHLERAAAYEDRARGDRPVQVEILSAVPLERLDGAQGATWLDRELIADAPVGLRDGGFGREVRAALAARRQWLLLEGLAEQGDGAIVYRSAMLATLRARELGRVAPQLSAELDLPFRDAKEGDRIEGRPLRRVDLVSGRFALVERAHDFSLVPWRSALEGHVGKSVSGILRGEGINWSIGRGRGGPTIS